MQAIHKSTVIRLTKEARIVTSAQIKHHVESKLVGLVGGHFVPRRGYADEVRKSLIKLARTRPRHFTKGSLLALGVEVKS